MMRPRPSAASAAGLAFDAALRELERIEELLQLRIAEIRLRARHLADGATLFVSLLRDRGAFVVADHGIQGRDENRIAFERIVESNETRMHLVAADSEVARVITRSITGLPYLLSPIWKYGVSAVASMKLPSP